MGLATEVDQARITDVLSKYVNACGVFHRYSLFNQFLIYMDNPDATRVAGFTTWKKLNRFAKKGEHGIPILAPCIYKKEDSKGKEKTNIFFKTVYVFDVAQTEGDPLPQPPEWISPEQDANLFGALKGFAESNGFTVMIRQLDGDAQGVARNNGTILIAPTAGTKTLIHEIAHELLHFDKKVREHGQEEIEAESIAYVVAKHFGLQDLKSPNYLALHHADGKKIMETLETIRTTASRIIEGISPTDLTACE
jgi:hypothetical protein